MKNKKKISIFYFLLFLIVTSILIVIYISNIIYVNNLVSDNNNLKEEINKNIQKNGNLSIEIEKLSSFERISQLASQKFNISYKENSVDDKNTIVMNKTDNKKN